MKIIFKTENAQHFLGDLNSFYVLMLREEANKKPMEMKFMQ